MSVSGKVVLITGAARGIGFGIAHVLASSGAKVVLADILQPELADAVSAIQQTDVTAHGIYCDISTSASCQVMVDEAVRQYGRIDALVACAASSRRGPFLEVTEDDLHSTLSATLFGTFFSCQAAARQMVKQGEGGSLVIISSVHVLRHYPGAAAYNMGKAAVNSLSRTLAAELAPHRIRVNAVLPGWTDTPGELSFTTAKELKRGGESIPLGRMGSPVDMGNAVRYLISDDASYVTGSELLVDGGFTITH